MRTVLHRPATPSSLEQEVQRDLEGIPLEHFQIWGKTLDYERYQVHFLLLPEYCEQGLLSPSPEGYTYNSIERHECADIYCNRYMDAMQTRSLASSSTGHAETEASPHLVQYEISDYVSGQLEENGVLPHHGGNPIQLWEPVPYAMANPHYPPQPELYSTVSSVLGYPGIEQTW